MEYKSPEYYELRYEYNLLKDENIRLKVENEKLISTIKDIQSPKWGWKTGEEIMREVSRH